MQPPVFADQSHATQVLLVGVAPAVLGGLAGWLLSVSVGGYWAVQLLATVGGVLAGTEHRTARGAVVRGLVAGLVFGVSILVIRSSTEANDVVSLGSEPGLLPAVTAVASMALGALGHWLQSRLVRPAH
jgi:hypothetical protein